MYHFEHGHTSENAQQHITRCHRHDYTLRREYSRDEEVIAAFPAQTYFSTSAPREGRVIVGA